MAENPSEEGIKAMHEFLAPVSEDEQAGTGPDFRKRRGRGSVPPVGPKEERREKRRTGAPTEEPQTLDLGREELPARPGQADALDQLFADLPPDFDGCTRVLHDINAAFRQQLVVRYAPVLNACLRAADPQDADAKKQLASEVRERLEGLGLAIRCPKTGQPSALAAKQGPSNPRGQFFITPKGANRPSFVRTNLADLLPLDLVVDRPRREALDEWRDRAKQETSAQTS